MEENRKNQIYRIIMICLLVAFVTFMFTALFITDQFSNKGSLKYLTLPGDETTSELELAIKQVRAVIDSAYIDVEGIDEESLIQGAVKGYVEGLNDPYTKYMTAEEWAEYNTEALGNYTGIGVYLQNDEEKNEIKIIAPVVDGVAEEAGIKAGDIQNKIYKIKQNKCKIDKIKSRQLVVYSLFY